MTKILYMIGAGASATVLPIINDITLNKKVIRKGLASELIEFTEKVSMLPDYSHYLELCEEARDFTTPDTFAKFLYAISRDKDYIDFKKTISAYFLWKERIEQSSDNCLDKRVISFITTLANNKGDFPENVKIISWNYDTQFIRSIDDARKTVPNNSFVNNFKISPLIKDTTIDKMKLTFLHLNGIAGYSYDLKSNKEINKFLTENITRLNRDDPKSITHGAITSKIKEIFDFFSKDNENLMISFAWEKEYESMRDYHFANSKLEYAKALARATDILVVIGYSFPFFNREFDKEIFNEMPTLKKIYFQDPKLNGQYLYNQFNLDREKVDVEHIENVQNYFIPYEL